MDSLAEVPAISLQWLSWTQLRGGTWVSFRGRLWAFILALQFWPRSDKVTWQWRETAIPVLPGMLGGLKRWLLANGCAMWGGRSLPEGRGPSVAAELARKAHDECVSMGWACWSIIHGRQGINLAMLFMPPSYQWPKAAITLSLSLCNSRVVFSKGVFINKTFLLYCKKRI